ncbi:MAG: NAD(P)/FAD-dependent oxidoreductase [Dehalococcoidia bacterium]
MRNGTRERADVVVVGGGLAGLAAATYVARAGRSVVLFERTRELGGRATTQMHGGFAFNLGPHALYKKGAGIAVLRELGIEFAGATPHTSGSWIRAGVAHRLSPWSFATTPLVSAGGKLETLRLLASIPRMKAQDVQDIPLQQWIEEKVRHQEVRDLLMSLIRVSTYANDPVRMSAGLALAQVQLALKGVFYLDGGWQTLVDGLRQAATDAGARIVTGARVAAIEHAGAVRGVRLEDGTVQDAAAVIVAGGPQLAASLVEGNADLRRWADAAIPVRAACLDVGLRRLPNPSVRFALGIDRPLYFSMHSATAKLAPEGGAMIHLAKYLPTDDPDDANAIERELDGMLDLLQPGWREEISERRFLPNMIVANALPTAAGEGAAGRPGPHVPGIENLYIAGDWVGTEAWLSDASLSSAKRAAELLLASDTSEGTRVRQRSELTGARR